MDEFRDQFDRMEDMLTQLLKKVGSLHNEQTIQSNRLGRMETRLDGVDTKLGDVSEKLTGWGYTVGIMGRKQNELLVRIADLEAKVERLEEYRS